MSRNQREARTVVDRAVALALSCIFTATSVWSVAPAVVVAAPAPAPAPVEEASPPPPAAAPRVTVFGPQRYVRTTGAKNEYTTVVRVPAWVRSPFTLHVQNGELNGTYRVSSASIGVNGTIVAGTADFNVTVPSLDRAVVLTPETSLKVTLASKPTSYLVIGLAGTSSDGTAPTLTITAPANGAFVDTTTPALAIEYRDLAGAGEPAASGVDVSTLEVWLDGALRTSWFARRSNDATAVVPADAALAEGAHVLRARIADVAGNVRESTSAFTVDVTRPLVAVPQPAAGEFLRTAVPEIRVQYQDANLDASTLRVEVNGTDRTEWFQRGPTEAVAQVPAAQPLPTGPNQVVASIFDRARNKGTASTSFNIDVQAPAIAITQPARASRYGSGRIEAIVRYSDDQALKLPTFKATLDGGSITMSPGPAEATQWLEGLPEGRHVLSVEIADRAGNVASDQSEFWVDTGAPSVSVMQPAPGAKVNTARPAIAIHYSDAQGLAVGSFKLTLDGFERTSWCEANLSDATCALPEGEPLADGPHQIVVTISDLASNTGTGESGFTVDTVAPTASLVAPTAPTNVDPPLIELAFADVGTGVVPDSIHVFIDGEDHTGEFVRSETRAKGRPAAALSQGPHAVKATFKDQAENPGELEAGFVVDTEAPALAVTAPNTPFLNDAAPGIAIEWSDAVSGVRGNTLKVVLVRVEPPETRDITALLTPRPSGAEGAIPEADALADGGFHIQATVSDAAGNVATATAAFQVDTKAPTVTIDDPAEGAWIRTALPSIALHFADEGVGVDPTLTELLVDGADRSARLTCAPGTSQCTAALLAEESLAEGGHTLAVTVHDRAGNASTTAAVPHSFSVDTHAPSVGVIAPPRGSHVGSGTVPVLIQYGDPGGSGIHVGSVQVLVDGVDGTAEFTVTESQASATLALPDGPHNVIANVADWAANPAAADGPFWVDTTPPAVSSVSPATETYVSELDPSGRLTFDGQAQDLDGDLTVTCTVGGQSYSGSFANGSISCAVPLGENENNVQVTVTDRAGNHTDVGRTIVVDRTAPEIAILQPPDGSYTNATSLEVTGRVSDLHLDTVGVAGVAAVVDGGGFSANAVPIGEPPDVTLTATARDRAGNAGTSSVTLHVDRVAPEVHITSPPEGAVLTSGTVEVGGTIDDASPIAAASVNDVPAVVEGGLSGRRTFRAMVAISGAGVGLRAQAADAAGNVGEDTTHVSMDTTPPTIVIEQPVPDLATRAPSVRVVGRASDDLPGVKVRLGATNVPVVEGRFEVDVPLPVEGPTDVVLTAVDLAGNTTPASVAVRVDRTAPTLTVTAPAPNSVIPSLPFAVTGTVTDATDVTVAVGATPAIRSGNAWVATVGGLADGSQALDIVATDEAGNATRVPWPVVVDVHAPQVHITAPADQSVTRETHVAVTGTVQDAATEVSVVVNGVGATLAGSTFTAVVPLAVEGENPIHAQATDAAGHTAADDVRVIRDTTAPSVDLSAPPTLRRGQTAKASVVASDNLTGVARVTFHFGSQTIGPVQAPPFEADLVVPEGATGGQTIALTADAEDGAGNVGHSAAHGVLVTTAGAIVGQVLSDDTGLPVAGTRVRMGTTETTTDEHGRYAFPTDLPAVVLTAEKEGTTSVDRMVSVQSAVGTVPVDARLTPLAAPATVAEDEPVSSGPISLRGPSGVYRLTRLTPQGLPGLLPLGWSPATAFDVRFEGAAGAELSVTVTGLGAVTTVYLAAYDRVLRAWTMRAGPLAVADGVMTTTLPGAGSYALVRPDDEQVPVAAAGEPLAGVGMVALPDAATSTSTATPATLPPTGGTAVGHLTVKDAPGVPSGTVVQAIVTETFTLTSGAVASEEKRIEDIVLYRSAGELEAAVPITPSRSFATSELQSGKVHLDILAGREGVRGQSGGNAPVVLEREGVRLTVGQGALASDLAIDLGVTAISPFVPRSATLIPLAEVTLDFSGRELLLPARLAVPAAGATPADGTYLFARVERIGGIPLMTVVAVGAVQDDTIVPQDFPGLPGIAREGRYVLYRVDAPLGFVGGLTTSEGAPLRAVVAATGTPATVLPFIALSGTDGRFLLPALPGLVGLQATVPPTAAHGEVQAQVTVGQTATANIALSGVVAATVSPAAGAIDVPTNMRMEITAPVALDTTDLGSTLRLLGPSGNAVPTRTVVSGTRRTISLVPTDPLAPTTTYTLAAAQLKDVYGGVVSVPAVSFTTRADVPPESHPERLTFSYPDPDGLVSVSAPAGSLLPGTTVLIVNTGSAFVLSFTVGDQGDAHETLPASTRDVLNLTVTDPHGNVTILERSQYVDPVTGRTAVGEGGGVVSEDGFELRVPKGAVDGVAEFKLSSFTIEQGDPQPELEGSHFASGLKIETTGEPEFNKELKLAFPRPAEAPDGSFFYVYRKLDGPSGAHVFETIDYAEATADGKVVTASYPFAGYENTFGVFDAGAITKTQFNNLYLMWTYDQSIPGMALPGAITGRVVRPTFAANAATQTYAGVGAVQVWEGEAGQTSPPTGAPFAITKADGTFTMWEKAFTDGPVTIVAKAPGGEMKAAEALRVDPANWKTTGLRFQRNIAQATIALDPEAPPPPPRDIVVDVLRPVAAGYEKTGVIPTGASVVIAIRLTNADLETVKVAGVSQTVETVPAGSALKYDRVVRYPAEGGPALAPGSYKIEVVGRPVGGGIAITETTFFTVLAAGGAAAPVPGPPAVIASSTLPKDAATDVPVNVFPQVVFSEPVKDVPTHVHLIDDTGAEAATVLMALDPVTGRVVDLGAAGASAPGITSLTIQPVQGLKYGVKYTLRIDAEVVDEDQPPQNMAAPYESSFTTIALSSLTGAGGSTWTSPGIATVEDRAYLVEIQSGGRIGVLHSFDTTNAAFPDLVASANLPGGGRAVDLSAALDGGVEGATVLGEAGRVVAVATHTGNGIARPPNVLVFDTSKDKDGRIDFLGAASLTSSAVQGYVDRLFLRTPFLYVATFRKGVQVVDLARVKASLADVGGVNSPGFWSMLRSLNTDGEGFGQDAVTMTIPIETTAEPRHPGRVLDLKVGDYVVSGFSQPTIVGTGTDALGASAEFALIVASPLTGQVLFKGAPAFGEGNRLTSGQAVALTNVAGRDLAVIVGKGDLMVGGVPLRAQDVLATVDLTDDVANPVPRGIVALRAPATDVAVHGDHAFVGGASGTMQIVSLADPAQPFWAGTSQGVGSRLSMSDTGILFSTARTLFGGPGNLPEVSAIAVDPAACPLLDLLTPKVVLRGYRDPLNNVSCGAPAVIEFTLCQRAAVTIDVPGLPNLLGYLDGNLGSKVNISGQPLDPGAHVIQIPVDPTTANLDTSFQISATALADPSQSAAAVGEIKLEVENRSVLPVGHTFVKGVDILDGHVVQQATDIKIPGRNLGLEVSRTYSSASKSTDDAMGAGWAFNGESRLLLNSGCQSATVIPADGSAQVFTKVGTEFKPQRGYHSQLRANPSGGYVFTDKSGTEHYFLERDSAKATPDGGTYRIDHIREPHGDELRFRYNQRGRLVEIGEFPEEQPGQAVRTVTFQYKTVAGFDRIETASAPGLGITVAYGYDELGNLSYVKRTGSTLPARKRAPVWIERYTYSTNTPRDRYQMLSATDPNGSTVRYTYFKLTDPFPGDPKTVVVEGKEEYVRLVTEEERTTGETFETRFAYDATRAATDRLWTTTVTDARANDTLYTLNLNGSPLQIDEPLGKQTRMEWSDDALKTKETDAEGRVTDYFYADGRGNLTREVIRTPPDDHGDVETTYEYDARFNKLTRKVDAEGRVTKYEIDPARGDLLSTSDWSGTTGYQYALGHGMLTQTTPPRGGATQYGGFTSFGKPQTIVEPTGVSTTRKYDALGEMTDSEDTLGTVWHRMHVDYDGFGRPVLQRRESLVTDSDDELIETTYYAAGQPRRVKKGGGFSVTDYTLDGLNRVKETSVSGSGLSTPLVTTVLKFDGNGNKVDERDARGVVHHVEYDALNRVVEVSITAGPAPGPTGRVQSFTYWPHGGKKTETDISGSVTSYEYDGLYRLERKVFAESSAGGAPYAETYRYDKVGNLVRMVDRNGRATESDYDGLNRVVQERRPLGFTRTIKYDDDNGAHLNKTEETLSPQGITTRYKYDAANRESERSVLLAGAEGAGRVYKTVTQYPASGHAVRVQDPRGTWKETTLDGLDRVTTEVTDPRTLSPASGLDLTTETRYDPLGSRKRFTDARGKVTAYTSDAAGRLRVVQDALGQSSRYEYDGGGLKTSETDRRLPPVTRTFTYDNLGRSLSTSVAGVLSGVPWSQTTEYDDAARTRTDRDARSTPTVTQLDRMGRVVKVSDVNGDTVEFRYDGVDKRSEKDKRGHLTSFDYDDLDRLVHTKDRRGIDSFTVYRDAENAREEKDRRGIVRRTQLDPLGRVVRVVRDWGGLEQTVVEQSEYDANGNRVLQTDGESHQTQFVYDAANRLVRRVDGLGSPVESSTRFTVDANGNVTDEIDDRTPQGIHREFDALNRASLVRDGAGNTTEYGYDGEGNRTSVKEPAGQVTTYDYEELGKLRAVRPPGVPPTVYAYDGNRNRLSQEDAEHHVVTMQYDLLNRLTDTYQPGVPVQHQDYDANGNVTSLKDPKGHTFVSTYDFSDRLTKKTYPALASEASSLWRRTTEIAYGYDDNDNVASVDESVASGTDPPSVLHTARTYDRLDRLTGETSMLPDVGSRDVTYTYFKNGLRKSVAESSASTAYTYDAQNRLSTATTAGGTTSYQYFPDDLLQEVAYPSGVKATYAYDDADRLTSVSNARGAAVVSSYAYAYDPNGNRTSQVETNGGLAETTTYGYDDLNRLTRVTYPVDTAFPSGRVVAYGYDTVGNRIRETERDTGGAVLADKQGVFDNLNRLMSLNDLVDASKSTVFGYDDNGNQTSKTVGGVTTEYRYDCRDKMVEVVAAGGGVLGRFQYDFSGRRNLKIGADGPVRYVYDQTSVLAEYDETGTQKARYDYGSDRLISMSRSGEGRRWYSLDGLRSVVNLTDDSGSLVASYHLDAWGNFRFPTELSASRNRFAFTGYEWDPELGLFNAKARYFDPQIGRFTSQDSFLGQIDDPPSLHRYFYANDNPTRYIDLTGHGALDVVSTGFKSLGSLALDKLRGAHDTAVNMFGGVVYNAGQRTGLGGESFRSQAEAFTAVAQPIDEATARTFKSPAHFVTAVVEGNIERKQRYDEALERGDLEAAQGEAIGFLSQVAGARTAVSSIRATPGALAVTPEGAFVSVGGAVSTTPGGLAGAGVFASTNTKGNEATSVQENTPSKENAAPSKQVSVEGAPAPQKPEPKILEVDVDKYPESVRHMEEAGVLGRPLPVNRSGAPTNRAEALRGKPKQKGFDLDEAPPAVFRKPGDPVSVKPVTPCDNRGCGASLGNQARDVPEGGEVIIVPKKKVGP